jgi:uncharacterized membrane protein YidH (DUF202 family)
MTGDPAPPRSFAPERTALAWSRTGLAALGLAGVLLKAGITRGDDVTLAASGLALLTAAYMYVFGRARQTAASSAPSPTWMLVASLCCVAASATALAAVI